MLYLAKKSKLIVRTSVVPSVSVEPLAGQIYMELVTKVPGNLKKRR